MSMDTSSHASHDQTLWYLLTATRGGPNRARIVRELAAQPRNANRLAEELDVGYVVIESDEEEAKRLSDDGYQAINGDPEELADLERASIRKATCSRSIPAVPPSSASIV